MRSLRIQSSSTQRPGSGRVAGARSSLPLLPAAAPPPSHRRRRCQRLAASSSSSVESSSSSASSSSSSPSSSSLASSPEAPDKTSPAPLPPTGDIKPSGYSVADWAAAFDSQLEEFDYQILKKKKKEGDDDSKSKSGPVAYVEGEIPEALRGGTLYRNGPARFERGGERYAHMLDGDGYVCRFEFSGDGESVGFRSRFVKTRELVAEEYADRILFRSTFGTSRAGGPLANAFDFRLKNPANTHVVPWGGRLLALWEAGPPHELDPRSLETRPAPATLGGLVQPGSAPSTTGVSRQLDEFLGFGSAATAHPHVVPAPPGEADVWYGLREEGEEEEESGEDKKATSPSASMSSTSLSSSPSSSPSLSSSPSSSPSLSSSSPSWPSPTSRLATWAWQSQMTARGPNLSIEVAEFDASWRRVAKARLSLPGAAFNPHDFGVSPRHYVFFQGATTFKMLPYVVGLRGPAQCVKIGTGKLTVHVAPRGQSHPQHSRPVTLEAEEGGFLIHHAACFEDSETGEIVVWSSGWAPGELERLAAAAAGGKASSSSSSAGAAAEATEAAEADEATSSSSSFPSLTSFLSNVSSSSSSSSKTDDSMLGSWKVVLAGDFDGIPHSSLQEHRIDLKKGRVTRKTLFDDQAMEHPKCNPLLATRRPRFVYFTAARSLVPGKAAPPQAIVKLDVETGQVTSWAPGRRCFCEEIVYVPVVGGGGKAGEGMPPEKEDAGFLLAMVFDASRGASSLAVLDASDVSKGPVARVWLKHHVPHGLHGEWCARGAVGF